MMTYYPQENLTISLVPNLVERIFHSEAQSEISTSSFLM